MSRHTEDFSELGTTGPEPSACPPDVSDRNWIVKENYPHTFDTPLRCPNSADFRLFWTLSRPFCVENPHDRDSLHGFICESIRVSETWLDVLCRRGPCGRPHEYRLLRNEALDQLNFKLACLRMLEEWDSPKGMFRDHRCWKCQDGAKPCAQGNPRQCEYPRARND